MTTHAIQGFSEIRSNVYINEILHEQQLCATCPTCF